MNQEELNNILQNIIDINTPLTSILLKIKLLSLKISNTELEEWTSSELNGYSNNNNLPIYRYFSAPNIMVKFKNSQGEIMVTPIIFKDIDSLPIPIKESISSLESHTTNSGLLKISLPVNMANQIIDNDKLAQISIIELYIDIPAKIASSILTNLRSRLISFFYSINREQTNNFNINEIPNSKITTIMKQTIITNNGNNSVINTGDNSIINYSVSQGNNNELCNKLKEIGVSDASIQEITNLLKEETPEIANKEIPEIATVNWSSKILSWIKQTAQDLKIPTAAGTLANILSSFVMGK